MQLGIDTVGAALGDAMRDFDVAGGGNVCQAQASDRTINPPPPHRPQIFSA